MIRWWLAVQAVLIVFQAGLVVQNVDEQVRLVVMDWMAPVSSAGAAAILFYTAFTARKVMKKYAALWMLTAFAILSWAFADISWLVLEVFLKVEPYPSFADFFYLAYYPFSIIAVMHYPFTKNRWSEQVKLLLDLAIVIISATLIFWIFLISPVLFKGDDLLTFLISMAYPVMDLVLLWALIILMARPYQDRNLIPFLFLGLSIGLQIFSDVVYSIQVNLDTYTSGNLLDLGWQCGSFLYGIAGYFFLQSMAEWLKGRTVPRKLNYSFLFYRVWPFIPYIWLFGAYAILVMSFYNPLPISPGVLAVSVGVTIGLVVIRQVVAYTENLKLSDQLRNELIERARVEEELRKSETRYRAIVEDQTELICRFDPDGRLNFVNEAYCRYFGQPREALIGTHFVPYIPEEDRAMIEAYLATLGPEKMVGVCEHRVILPGGSIRWQQWTDRAILDDQGAVIEYASVGRDITERKQVLNELDHRAKEMSALYDMSMEINAQLDLSELLRSVLNKATSLINAPIGALYFRSYGVNQLRQEVSLHLPAEIKLNDLLESDLCLGSVVHNNQPLVIDDFQAWARANGISDIYPLRRLMGVPLHVGNESIGVILIADDQRTGNFSDDEIRLVMLFADQAAIAVENARLYDQAQEEIRQRKQMELILQQTNEELEQRVSERTSQLVEANNQLNLELNERKRAEEKIRASLAEKEVLLKEIHHRVKNNLQVISSLLNLQFSKIPDTETRQALIESQNRVRSMALIHEKIYQSKNLAEVDFREYIQGLAAYLFRSYRATNGNIHLDLKIDQVSLGIDNAVPCGLILNELISNALKYAFPSGSNGEITIRLCQENETQISLVVMDNGVGLPPTFDIDSTQSLGMQLVKMLVMQLGGEMQVASDGGARFLIQFPAYARESEEEKYGG